ncbi:hypothetical protein GBAR_LOCUS1083 [Geodia barretti]|uniref:Uncharacterized protein n=1 Tax=Geodia barretti TaxID=519541 RepID=A0AA35QVR5_GEOBA|nr:hypothetical protein GBAR_LOCUS1083 [Geodia barretti]
MAQRSPERNVWRVLLWIGVQSFQRSCYYTGGGNNHCSHPECTNDPSLARKKYTPSFEFSILHSKLKEGTDPIKSAREWISQDLLVSIIYRCTCKDTTCICCYAVTLFTYVES